MIFGSKSISFDAGKDIPSLAGKVILVTGGNIGLGKQAILELTRHHPAEIWLGTRDLAKGQAAAEDIKSQVTPTPNIKLLQLDLASLTSVKKAAAEFTASSNRLDILMLNAGRMAAPPGQTPDGYELQFGTNYLGHVLLVKLLLPMLENTAREGGPQADVRIVSVVSHGHHYAPKGGIQFDSLKTPGDNMGPYNRYGQSKLAMVLWTRYMASLYPQFTVAAIHPGVVQTNLLSGATGPSAIFRAVGGAVLGLIKVPVEKGVRNQLWAAVAKEVKSGEYFEPVGVMGKASVEGKDDELSRRLWEWTETELRGYLL